MIIDPVAVELYILRSLLQRERNSADALGLWQLEVRLSKNGQPPFWLPLQSVKGLPSGPVDEPRLQAMTLDLKQVPFQVVRHSVKTVEIPPLPPITEAELWIDAELMPVDSASLWQAITQLQTAVPEQPSLIIPLVVKQKFLHEAWLSDAREWIADHYDMHYLTRRKRPLKPARAFDVMLLPNRPLRTPKKAKKTLDGSAHQVYTCVWERFLAWQMIPMTVKKMELAVSAGKNNRYLFQRQSEETINRGFLQMMPGARQSEATNTFWKSDALLSAGTELELVQVRVEKRKSVIRTLSTAELYAERPDPQFISTKDFRQIVLSLAGREYIAWDKGGWRLTDLGRQKAGEACASSKNNSLIMVCEKCGQPMALKQGPYGRFWGCTGYPRCRQTLAYQSVIPCPVPGCCGRVVERKTKSGKRFFGCSRYPECRFASWNRPTNISCHHCHACAMEERVDERGQKMLVCPQCGSAFYAKSEGLVAS